ncbi:hypothetical protein [Rufibacter tibetensis]|nr:hypothetical protein [Rufibacter tibetensis]
MINKKEYPLFFLRDVKSLMQQTREFVKVNDDVLVITKNEEFEITIKDSAKDSNFEFSIFKPYILENRVNYTVQFNPINHLRLDIHKVNTTSEFVIDHLKKWTRIIKEYNLIDLSPEEKILSEYEREFYDEFEIVDEDADVLPYNLETQVKIHAFLLHAVNVLRKDEEENSALIIEASDLQNDLPNLTKKNTVKRLSKFFAKVRQKSLPLLKEILVEGKKEIFKRMISSGFDNVVSLIDLIK